MSDTLDNSNESLPLNNTGRKRKRKSSTTTSKKTSKPSKSRKDRSLIVLTQRFYEIVLKSDNGIINMKDAAQQLGVEKRRIYDITNVLEGINLIHKHSKNKIQWNFDSSRGFLTSESSDIENNFSDKLQEEEQLDKEIKLFEEKVQKLIEGESSNYAYITYNDIKSIESLADQTVIAINAPRGTDLEVPKINDSENVIYEMYLTNYYNQPIHVYLVSSNEEQNNTAKSICSKRNNSTRRSYKISRIIVITRGRIKQFYD